MQCPLSFSFPRNSQSFSVLFQREPSYCAIVRPVVLAHSFPFILPLPPFYPRTGQCKVLLSRTFNPDQPTHPSLPEIRTFPRQIAKAIVWGSMSSDQYRKL